MPTPAPIYRPNAGVWKKLNRVNISFPVVGGGGGTPAPSTWKIMFLGDSLTAVDNTALGMKGYIMDQLTAAGKTYDSVGSVTATGPSGLKDFQHEGHPGWQTGDFTNVITGYINSYQPHIINMHLGTNDVWSDVATATALARYRDLLDKIYAASTAGVHVIIHKISQNNVGRDAQTLAFNNGVAQIYTDYNAAGKKISIHDNNAVVTKSFLQNDGIHWIAFGAASTNGHLAAANSMTPVILNVMNNWTGGAGTGGGGTFIMPAAGNTIAFTSGGTSRTVTNVNGSRGVDEMVVFNTGSATTTNQYGTEVSVGYDGKVSQVNNRLSTGSTTGTTIPSGGYVLSGHGAASDFLLANATVGATVYVNGASTGNGGGTGTGGTPTTGGTTGFEAMTYPVHAVEAYHMVYSGDTNFLGNIPANVNVVKLSFGEGDANGRPKIVGYTVDGISVIKPQIAALRARGVRVGISVGGSGSRPEYGNALNFANTTAFISGITQIATDLGGLDCLDFDWEGTTTPPTTAQLTTIMTGLRTNLGPNFSATMAPNGSNINDYRPLGVHMFMNGWLKSFMHQYYDAQVSYPDVAQRIDQWIAAVIAAGGTRAAALRVYSIGCMDPLPATGYLPTTAYWTTAQSVSMVNQAIAQYGIIGHAGIWEMKRNDVNNWISQVGNIILGQGA